MGRIFGLFDEADDAHSWNLTPIHMIVLGLSPIDLENYLSLSTIEIDSQDRFGRTALMWASRRNDPKHVEILLSFGARLDIVNSLGMTAFAESLNSTECLELLLGALKRCSTYDQAMNDSTPKLVPNTTRSDSCPRNLPEKFLGNPTACRELHLAAACGDYTTMYILRALGMKGLNPDNRDVDEFTAWQLFDNFRPLFPCEDTVTRPTSKRASERLVEIVSPLEPTAILESFTHASDSEEESLTSDLDEFFDAKIWV